MKQLLIVGETILAVGHFFDDAEELRVYLDPEMTQEDGIYPHHVMPGYVIGEADLPADFNCADYLWQGGLVKKPMPAPSQSEKDDLIKQIDSDADAIIFSVIGNREKEYSDAYADAKAFAASGYAGAPPTSVADWAAIKGRSLQWAADNVIATGEAWVAASAAIRKNRLARKEDVRNATTAERLVAVTASWEAFKSQIRAQLGL